MSLRVFSCNTAQDAEFLRLGRITKFDASEDLSVPHIGWNTFEENRPSPLLSPVAGERVYFVHSYRAETCDSDWSLATSTYGSQFISASAKLEVMIDESIVRLYSWQEEYLCHPVSSREEWTRWTQHSEIIP